MKLLVTGGNGFIGRQICARAISDGHDVVSVARSGPPEESGQGEYEQSVDWLAADVFSPQEWRDALDEVDRVIHSIGTLSESPNSGVTLERTNGDSAIVAGLEAERAGVERFVYISSSTKPPLVRDAYLTARRRAEGALAELEMPVVIPRFGPVYGPDQPHFPSPLNTVLTAVGRFESVASRLGKDRPFSVEQASEATYRLAIDDTVPEGPVGAETLSELASRADG